LEAIHILYDGECPLCFDLAQWAKRHGGTSVTVESWQDFFDSSPNPYAELLAASGWDRSCPNLRAIVEGRLVEGPDAWERIIAALPELSKLQWLASRLGLTTALAKAVNHSGKVTRRWCRACGGRRAI
jgi:predicted DCC family thiol-disulfide oxidoreductase YuxK